VSRKALQKMHKLTKDKGKVDYILYENECDGDDEFPLKLRTIYNDAFDRRLYCAWLGDQQLPSVYEVFHFWGYDYIIQPSNIHGANMGIFVVDNAHVESKH